MNPRDCRYWMSGDCLNTRCLFRHLPREGRTVSASVSLPPVPNSTSLQSTLMTAAVGPSKSKTPCYFFSKGCCAKKDECPFMHGTSVVSTTGAGAQQRRANGHNGKSMQANDKLVVVLHQNGAVSQDTRSVLSLSSNAPAPVHGAPWNPTTPTTLAPSWQKNMAQDVIDRTRRSQPPKKAELQGINQSECNEHVRIGGRRNQNGSRKEGFLGREGEFCLQSDVQESTKGPSSKIVRQYNFSSNAKTGVKERDNEHLIKRRRINDSQYTSTRNNNRGGQSSTVDNGRSSQQLSDNYAGWQGKRTLARPVSNRTGKSLPTVELKSSPNKYLGTQLKRVHCTSDVAPLPDKRNRTLECNRTSLQDMKENLTFTGPKSLAQIKAEKLARGISSDDDLSSKAAASGIPTTKKSEAFNQKTCEDFEGPKPLSLLLRKKRKLESDSEAEETMPGCNKVEVVMLPNKVDVSMLDSPREIELDNDSKSESSHGIPFSPLSSQDELDAGKDVSEQVRRSLGVDAAEDDIELSEDELGFDMEIEENAYVDDYYEIDDDEDDDFAKKLGSFLAMSTA